MYNPFKDISDWWKKKTLPKNPEKWRQKIKSLPPERQAAIINKRENQDIAKYLDQCSHKLAAQLLESFESEKKIGIFKQIPSTETSSLILQEFNDEAHKYLDNLDPNVVAKIFVNYDPQKAAIYLDGCHKERRLSILENMSHAPICAKIVSHLNDENAAAFLDTINQLAAASYLDAMQPEKVVSCLNAMPPEKVVSCLNAMPPEKVVSYLSEKKSPDREELLFQLNKETIKACFDKDPRLKINIESAVIDPSDYHESKKVVDMAGFEKCLEYLSAGTIDKYLKDQTEPKMAEILSGFDKVNMINHVNSLCEGKGPESKSELLLKLTPERAAEYFSRKLHERELPELQKVFQKMLASNPNQASKVRNHMPKNVQEKYNIAQNTNAHAQKIKDAFSRHPPNAPANSLPSITHSNSLHESPTHRM